MMNRINGVLRIHFKDIAIWLFIPIGIFLVNVVLSLALSLFQEQVSMKNSIVTLYVFMFILGILTVGRTFYFAVGLSVRRKDYMLGTMIMLGTIATIISVFFALISVLENYFSFDLGIMFDSSFTLNSFSFLGKLYINFSVLIHMFLVGMLINCLIRQFGKHLIWVGGLFILVIVNANSINLAPLDNLLTDTAKFISELSPLMLITWSLPVSLLYAYFSYMILRRLPA